MDRDFSDEKGTVNTPQSRRHNANKYSDRGFWLILPVLFYEYLAIAMTRSLIPTMVVASFGDNAYFFVGITETIKGILAFASCPLWGRLSDRIGRRFCLLGTVIGSTLPFCALAFTQNMYVYSFFLAISGFFAATFPLAFAYISDCVRDKKKRAPAYGLALATFGLSFCIGPLTGSYLAKEYGHRVVFISSFILVLVDVLYILYALPETVKSMHNINSTYTTKEKLNIAYENLPTSLNISDTFRVFKSDPFMMSVAFIVFLYYTSVWAIVSTLMVYVTRHLNFSPLTLGWLLSGYGLSTMFSEGVVVRLVVPVIGETNSIRIGLASFAVQCIIVAFSTSSASIFISVLFSMISNLVYPSVSSLVSKLVEEGEQGEALGALNGIKALTEGFGPLIFGLLMGYFENTSLPGAPYLVAAAFSAVALFYSIYLPTEPEFILSKKESFKAINNQDNESASSLLDK